MRALRHRPVLLALLPAVLLAVPLRAGDEPDPVSALQHGQASLLLRPRYEAVDDRGAGKTADALTNRLVLGYRTGAWEGLSAYAEFESVTALQTPPRYFVPQTGYGDPARAAVVDPALTQVNQLYLAWKGLKVGRQAVNLDDQRFIGTVGWRQNDQTFTGASFTNATWIPRTSFTVARFTQVAPITGITRDLRLDVVNARVALQAARVTLNTEIDPRGCPPSHDELLALVLREAITNIVRHSGARTCSVETHRDGATVRLTIRDDGRGGNLREGNGLRGMRERLSMLDGVLHIESDRRGTLLTAVLPLKGTEAPDTQPGGGAQVLEWPGIKGSRAS